MEIKLSIPQSSTEFEMSEIKESFEIDGDKIRFTDQTGGTDWDVPFITYALSLIGISLTLISTGASKEIGKKLGSAMGDDAVKLYTAFKNGVKKLLSKKERSFTHSPYLILQIISNIRTYEIVFELGLLNENDYDLSFAQIIDSAINFISNYEKSNPIINEQNIGVVMYWNCEKKDWIVTLIEGIDSNGRIYNFNDNPQ